MAKPNELGATTPSTPRTDKQPDGLAIPTTASSRDAKIGLPAGPDVSGPASSPQRTEPDSEAADDEGDEWEATDDIDSGGAATGTEAGVTKPARTRRRRRQPKLDCPELRLCGRRALCMRIEDIAPNMLKMVKLRILTNHLASVRGLEDDDLTRILKEEAKKLTEPTRVLEAVQLPDTDFSRGQLKAMILNVLLQEETYSLPENRLDEKVIEFETALVERSKSLDLSELRKEDPDRWHHLDTYRIVLDAAWSDDDSVSPDEARLLGVLRGHLSISQEEHWLISILVRQFPKPDGTFHTADEVNEARKELQRQALLWQYRDEDNQNIDVIPTQIAEALRRDCTGLELQAVNFRRLLSLDSILLADLREALENRGLEKSGSKAELIERVVTGEVKPSELLNALDREKLSTVCGGFGLKSSGAKAELVTRLVDFYDDLTFEERVTKDERETWYNEYELLASRGYAELRAKKVITRDLDIQALFEEATAFLFEVRLRATCDTSRKENRADGRLHLESDQSLLWDCKSAEELVNLQDHLDTQFDGYLRKERELGRQPIGFLVIGPAFTPQSVRLANQYKARTNCDVALVTAIALKHLADRWTAIAPDKPFPIRLLNRTEVIDKERAEFLLSLA